jgi:nucleotide-binding universal stress UspA family protein
MDSLPAYGQRKTNSISLHRWHGPCSTRPTMPLVCGTDFSECAAQATAAATAIAARFAEDLWLVHVIELSFEPERASMEAVRTYAEQRLKEHAQRLQPRLPGRVHCAVLSGAPATVLADFAEEQSAAGMNIMTRTEIVHSDDVIRSICQSAERLGADVICVASHGRSAIVQTLLGSVTEGVMRHSRVPVLVAQPLPR